MTDLFVGLLAAVLLASSSVFQPVPLEKVTVNANCVDLLCEVELEQLYVIPPDISDKPAVEIMYVFPIDANSAVNGFSAKIEDGPEIIGIVKIKEEATQEYKEAIERGQTAFLMEQETRDVFKLSLGNVQPGKSVLIKLKYVTENTVENQGKHVRFTLPTDVAPRYGETQLSGSKVGYLKQGLSINLKFASTGQIKGASSPSHPISLKSSDEEQNVMEVKLGSSVKVLDRDFVVLLDISSGFPARGVVERGDDSINVALSFIPGQADLLDDGDDKTPTFEYVFVVDNSGSMQGSKVDSTRKALKSLLFELPQNSFFNIVKFGSQFRYWKSEAAQNTRDNLLGALEFARHMQADMGGTELFNALSWVLNKKVHPDAKMRKVFVLTDGEIWNPETVIELAHKNSDKSQIFSLGIGDSASRYLVEGLARAGKGVSQFTLENEEITSKALHLLDAALQSGWVCRDFKFTRDDQDSHEDSLTEFSPVKNRLPAMRSNNAFIGYFTKEKKGDDLSEFQLPTMCHMICTSEKGKQHVLNIPIQESSFKDSSFVRTLAARTAIRELEEINSQDNIDEIEELGLKNNLVSSRTSFIAVDRTQNVPIRAVQVQQKISEERGVFDVTSSAYESMSFGSASPRVRASVEDDGQQDMSVPGIFAKDLKTILSDLFTFKSASSASIASSWILIVCILAVLIAITKLL